MRNTELFGDKASSKHKPDQAQRLLHYIVRRTADTEFLQQALSSLLLSRQSPLITDSGQDGKRGRIYGHTTATGVHQQRYVDIEFVEYARRAHAVAVVVAAC